MLWCCCGGGGRARARARALACRVLFCADYGGRLFDMFDERNKKQNKKGSRERFSSKSSEINHFTRETTNTTKKKKKKNEREEEKKKMSKSSLGSVYATYPPTIASVRAIKPRVSFTLKRTTHASVCTISVFAIGVFLSRVLRDERELYRIAMEHHKSQGPNRRSSWTGSW